MTATSITPCFVYENAEEAIEWLCNAFCFEKKMVVPTKNGKIAHAALVLGKCMIMTGSANSGSEFSKLIRQPSEIDGFVTQSPYIVLDDDEIEAHYDRARRHGAKIVSELKEEDYGGKHYMCYDPEGHLWSFGSYDPWAD